MRAASASWRLRALVCASVALFVVLVARFWHPVYGFTAFFQLDAANDDLKIAAFRELPVFVYRDTGGYDGLYYAQIAQDPSLRDPELPRAMDNFGYRARRILPPAVAWLFGLGQPAAVVRAYSVLNIAAWFALAWLLWRTLARSAIEGADTPVAAPDGRTWVAWSGILFSAGALGSVRLALTDLPALVLIVAAMAAAERWRGRRAVAILGAAALARETALIAIAGLCKAPWFSAKNLARVALATLPLAAWLLYVRTRAGAADQGWANFTWPGAAFVEKWRAAVDAVATLGEPSLAWSTLLATGALTIQAVFVLLRPSLGDRWWRLGAGYVLLLLLLGTAVWEGFPGAATRVVLPLNVAFNVVALRRRAPLVWLLLGNLTVFAGFAAMREVPRDPREVAALRVSGTAAVARIGEGWHAREQHGRNAWSWTARGGTVKIETWPKEERTLVLAFELRGYAPCTVVLTQEGRELGRYEVTTTRSSHAVYPLRVAGGHATLEFSTTAAPSRESDAPGARELGFALYNVRLGLKKL